MVKLNYLQVTTIPVKNRKEKIFGCFLLFAIFTTSMLFAQEDKFDLDKWIKYSDEDKFGDPTGTYYWGKGVLGTGENSIETKSTQRVGIRPVSNTTVGFGLADQSEFSMPLNMLFMGPEQISLYLKDSNGKTYTFNGNQISSDGGQVTILINSTKLMSLLQKNDTYKAVIEGDNWKCDFSFSGNMPK